VAYFLATLYVVILHIKNPRYSIVAYFFGPPCMLSFFTLKILATASLIQSSNASAFFYFTILLSNGSTTQRQTARSCLWVGLTRGLGWVGSVMGSTFLFSVGWLGHGSEMADLQKMRVVHTCNFGSSTDTQIHFAVRRINLMAGQLLFDHSMYMWFGWVRVGLSHGSIRSPMSGVGWAGSMKKTHRVLWNCSQRNAWIHCFSAQPYIHRIAVSSAKVEPSTTKSRFQARRVIRL